MMIPAVNSSKLCLASKATQLDGQIVLISPYGSHGPLMTSLAIKHDDFYSYVSLPEGKFFAFDYKRNMKLLIVISFLWRLCKILSGVLLPVSWFPRAMSKPIYFAGVKPGMIQVGSSSPESPWNINRNRNDNGF